MIKVGSKTYTYTIVVEIYDFRKWWVNIVSLAKDNQR